MKTKSKYFIPILFCLLLFSCKRNYNVSGNGFEGIILHSDTYIPTEDEIADLESKTKPFIQNFINDRKKNKTGSNSDSIRINQYTFVLKNLSYYKRRYKGQITIKGEKVIVVEAILVYPGDHTLDGLDWKTVHISDGGEAVYHIGYSTEKKEITGFEINSNG